jgi:alanine racemase
MEQIGVGGFCVDSIVEGIALRRAGMRKPILVLGATLGERVAEASELNIAITVSHSEALKKIISTMSKYQSGNKLPVHIKMDSGMHRQGFYNDQNLRDALKLLKQNSRTISLDGVYTHFAAAKNPAFPGETEHQLEEFHKAVETVKSAGFAPHLHAAATSAALLFPETRLDMVRIGIGLYGLWPSKETNAALEDRLKLKPALSWHTLISEIKNVRAGERIGYDFTELLSRNSRIAILPIGYWHGYPRALSGIGHVLVRGKRAKIAGRVSMDMAAIDVTDIPDTKYLDIVTMLGYQEDQQILANELADLAGTINYEIITRINPLIKRIYV